MCTLFLGNSKKGVHLQVYPYFFGPQMKSGTGLEMLGTPSGRNWGRQKVRICAGGDGRDG